MVFPHIALAHGELKPLTLRITGNEVVGVHQRWRKVLRAAWRSDALLRGLDIFNLNQASSDNDLRVTWNGLYLED